MFKRLTRFKLYGHQRGLIYNDLFMHEQIYDNDIEINGKITI